MFLFILHDNHFLGFQNYASDCNEDDRAFCEQYVSSLVRSDRGTENSKVAFLQPFLRRHRPIGEVKHQGHTLPLAHIQQWPLP